MKKKWKKYCCIAILLICFAALTSHGSIQNGAFNMVDPNDSMDFFYPSSWSCDNYVAVHNQTFAPEPEHGQLIEWTIPPLDGNYALLSSGDIGTDGTTDHAVMSQMIETEPGQKLFGMYFFGTCDWFNDYAAITLIPDVNDVRLDIIEILYISVLEIGTYQSTETWQTFGFTFNEDNAGSYELVFEVADDRDDIYKTYLAVDQVRLCRASSGGDINYDGQTDLEDFHHLAKSWYTDCNDPNISCNPDTDLNGDRYIDEADLLELIPHWISGECD